MLGRPGRQTSRGDHGRPSPLRRASDLLWHQWATEMSPCCCPEPTHLHSDWRDWYPPLPILLIWQRRLPPPRAGQVPQLWCPSGSARSPWGATCETLSTALDKWQLRAVFCQSWQAVAAKPERCGRMPSPGVPFPVTNKEWAVSFWTQQLVLEGQLSDLLCAISLVWGR